MTAQDNWFGRTGQRWKLRVFYLLLLVLVAVAGLSLLSFQGLLLVHYNVQIGLLWSGCGVLALAWLALAFRCQNCQVRIGWWYLRSAEAKNWFTEFQQLQRCPACSSSGSSR
jgi:hypothetical protein